MKTSAVGVREGRREGRRGARGCSVGCRPKPFGPIALLTAPRAGSLPQGHVPLFSLIARRAHCKRLITAFPDQAATVDLPADGRGKGARGSASKSRPPVPTVKFSKNPRVAPQAASVGNGPRVPPLIAPPNPLPARAGGGVRLLAGSARRGRGVGGGALRGARPSAAAENGSGCERIAVIG